MLDFIETAINNTTEYVGRGNAEGVVTGVVAMFAFSAIYNRFVQTMLGWLWVMLELLGLSEWVAAKLQNLEERLKRKSVVISNQRYQDIVVSYRQLVQEANEWRDQLVMNGRDGLLYALFSGNGFHPHTGEILQPADVAEADQLSPTLSSAQWVAVRDYVNWKREASFRIFDQDGKNASRQSMRQDRFMIGESSDDPKHPLE